MLALVTAGVGWKLAVATSMTARQAHTPHINNQPLI